MHRVWGRERRIRGESKRDKISGETDRARLSSVLFWTVEFSLVFVSVLCVRTPHVLYIRARVALKNIYHACTIRVSRVPFYHSLRFPIHTNIACTLPPAIRIRGCRWHLASKCEPVCMWVFSVSRSLFQRIYSVVVGCTSECIHSCLNGHIAFGLKKLVLCGKDLYIQNTHTRTHSYTYFLFDLIEQSAACFQKPCTCWISAMRF